MLNTDFWKKYFEVYEVFYLTILYREVFEVFGKLFNKTILEKSDDINIKAVNNDKVIYSFQKTPN